MKVNEELLWYMIKYIDLVVIFFLRKHSFKRKKKAIDFQYDTPTALGNIALRQNVPSSAGNARLQPSGSTLSLYTFIIINYGGIRETVC